MTLESNFILPATSVTEAETKKREALIAWFKQKVDHAVVGLIVTGSMSYGCNYSVKESSDIDMQLIITPETADKLTELGLFDESELSKALAGYKEGVYGQFSLVFEKDGVSMECHFWGLPYFVKAITYQTSETRRLRTSIETPSTDYGFSFGRKESIKDYYGEMIGEYAVGVLPSYRKEGDTIYLCRPITNIVSLPRIEKSSRNLDLAMDQAWRETVLLLKQSATDGRVDLDKVNVENSMPGKNKARPDVLAAIRQRTRDELEKIGAAFVN